MIFFVHCAFYGYNFNVYCVFVMVIFGYQAID